MPPEEAIRAAVLAHELRASSIFSGLGMPELLQIAGYSERMILKTNQILFREGDPVIGFYIVIRGCIKAYRINEAGREQVIHLIHAGGSFAEPAVAGLPGYPAHTKALEPTEVALIQAQPFLAHLRINSDLALRMLASLSRHLHELVATIEGYRLRDAETRLMHWLLRQTGGSSGPVAFELSIPKSVLASELGTRQETLSRLFSKLRAAGALKVQGKKFLIENPGTLRNLFEENLSRTSTTGREDK